MIIIDLVYNLSIIVSASVLSGFIDKRFNRNTRTGKIIQGLVFGFIAIIAMLNPYKLTEGVFFDGRSIILSLGALFFGNTAGIISGVMAIIVRIFIGGSGAYVGSSVIMSSVLIGLLFNYLHKNDYIIINAITLYLFGILVHLIMLALMFFLPANLVWITFQTIAITVISVYPFVTILIGKILTDQSDNIELLKDLKESEEKHKSIIENSFDVIYTISATGYLTYVSQAWEIVLGHKKEEVIGKHFSQFVYPDDVEECFKFLEKVLQTKKRQEGIEYRVKHKDGTWRWHNTSAVPLTDKEGNAVGFEGIARDITETKKFKLKLEASEEKLRYFIQNSPMAVIEWNNEQKITGWTGEAENIFGYCAYEVIGKNMEDLKLIFEPDIEKVKKDIELLISGVQNYVITINRNYTKSGKIIYCEWYNTVRKDRRGKLLYSLSQVLDITERKKAEIELAENQRRLKDIITFLPDATFAIDKNHKIIIWNKAIEEMTGYSSEIMIGKSNNEYAIPFYGKERPVLLDLIFLENEEIKSRYNEIVKRGDSYTTNVYCPSLYNNKGAWLFSKASPLYNNEGEIIGAIESLRDITSQKMIEEAERSKLERITLQQELLIETATSEYLNRGDLKLISQFLTEKIAKLLRTERTSIWLFNDDFTKMECLNLYELSKDIHSKGEILTFEDFSSEFEALKRSKYVDANDPYNDPRTKGYVNSYLKKYNITAILDSVVRFSDKLLGLVCVEHVGVKHTWDNEEISFLCQLADQIAIAISNNKRKIAEKSLKKLSLAVEQSQVSIIITNKEAQIEYVNPRFLEISGYTLSEVFGKKPNILSSDYHSKEEFDKMWALLNAGENWNGVFKNKN
ncbi:MAG TPA: PAS domain S-box protein, partial [Melioribacteraceae bacterium]|nr:PAS domain S-box protein [Melioribacteraceae bacterium]